jgi:hypothetical protein
MTFLFSTHVQEQITRTAKCNREEDKALLYAVDCSGRHPEVALLIGFTSVPRSNAVKDGSANSLQLFPMRISFLHKMTFFFVSMQSMELLDYDGS